VRLAADKRTSLTSCVEHPVENTTCRVKVARGEEQGYCRTTVYT
jgi:hypothetical protein